MNDGKIDNVRITVTATNADDAERLISTYASKHLRASHVTLDIVVSSAMSPDDQKLLDDRLKESHAIRTAAEEIPTKPPTAPA